MCQLLPSSANVHIAQALVNFDSKFDMSKLEVNVKPKKAKKSTAATRGRRRHAKQVEEEEEEDIHCHAPR